MTQIPTNRVTYGVEDRPRNTLTPWQEPWHGRYEARTRRQTWWLMNASVRNAAALFTGDCFFFIVLFEFSSFGGSTSRYHPT